MILSSKSGHGLKGFPRIENSSSIKIGRHAGAGAKGGRGGRGQGGRGLGAIEFIWNNDTSSGIKDNGRKTNIKVYQFV